ncbi:MAG: profilin [Amphiamblys sp. WSBS2006]|nr:MAG: profilin [Amphiamblys sp. WSBS2006]
MSWQEYVEETMIGTGTIKSGVIVSHEGDIWACSKDISPTDAELKEIIGAFEDSSTIRSNGVHISGVKYFTLKCDQRSIYGKNKADGCICVRTNQTVLIGLYGDGMPAGNAAKTVEELGDYFIEQGY